jgi:predicted permease
MRDLSLAIRVAARRPWVTASTVVLVGVALAVNTALYSAIHVLVLREIPARDPGTLAVAETQPGQPISQATLDVLQRHSAFLGVGAVVSGSESGVDLGVFVSQATANLADILGAAPVRGSWLTDEEPDGVVVAWSFWQARFGGRAESLGQPVDLAGRRRVLVGVMPPGFDFPLGTNAWELVRRSTGADYSRFASLTAIARLSEPPGVRSVPLGTQTVSLVPLRERYAPSGGPALFLLVWAGTLVLTLTLLHLMALCLTQAARQRGDAAIRLALGANRRHLFRQTLAEASIPAIGGLVAAIPLTIVLQAGARRWLPPELLRGSVLTFDLSVLALGSVLAVVVLGVISSAQLVFTPSVQLRHAIMVGGGGRSGGRRAANAVLALQTACAVALVYLCLLAVMSLRTVQRVDLGFNPTGLLSVRLPWDDTSLDGFRAQGYRVDESLAAIRAVPGVSNAAPTFSYPFAAFNAATTIALPGGITSSVALLQVGPGYFETIGARLLSGRAFDFRSKQRPPLSAVVNESLARSMTKDGVLPGSISVGGLSHEIIGVVDDVRMRSPEVDSGFQVYVSIVERRAPATVILVRTTDDGSSPAALAGAVQAAWGGKTVRVERVQDTLGVLLAPQRTRSALISGVALAGLGLTVVALAGGLVEGVRSRTRELAVRLAVGAGQGRVIMLVVSEGLFIVTVGAALGLGVGAIVGQSLATIFRAASGLELRAAVVVAVVFVIVGLLSTIQAAVLACRVNTALALKHD